MEANNCPSFDKLLCQTIKYNDSIKIDSKSLIEVYHYTRIFNTNKKYKMCTVRLSIPFTGNNGGLGARSRILLYLDEELICDGSMHNGIQWELKPLQLYGEVFELKPGEHTVRLKCCVSGNELYIPHYNIKGAEFTIKPEISGKMVVLGFN